MAVKRPVVIIRSSHAQEIKAELQEFERISPRSSAEAQDRTASLVTVADEQTVEESARLSEEDDVLDVVPNLLFSGPKEITNSASTVPTVCTWGIKAIGAERVSVEDGREVSVAILDSGISRDYKSHPAFSEVNIEPVNFTDEDDWDTDGHGTHCAGIIFGQDVGGVRIGVAPRVKQAFIAKVTGDKEQADTDKLFRAMSAAIDRSVDIISMSLGMDFPGYQRLLMDTYSFEPEHATSIALSAYRQNIRAFDKISSLYAGGGMAIDGAIVIAASGNDSKRPDYSITVSPPAAGSNVVSVGALKPDLKIASFSNDEVLISAPGVGIWSANHEGDLHELVEKDGTSMAAPHVAGAAILWAHKLKQIGRYSPARLRDELVFNAKQLSGSVEKDVGRGLVQAPKP